VEDLAETFEIGVVQGQQGDGSDGLIGVGRHREEALQRLEKLVDAHHRDCGRD